MKTETIFLIALALAVDAFAVAVAAGVKLRQVGRRQTFRLAFHFGLFQGLMTLLGWTAGLSVRSLIEQFDHWIAFGLLTLVGLHMIVEALRTTEAEKQANDPTRGATMVMLSVATSIDALAVGLTFSMLNIAIWWPALVIGLVALLLTAIGLHLGRMLHCATRLGAGVEIMGGLVLLGIGVKILHEHGVF